MPRFRDMCVSLHYGPMGAQKSSQSPLNSVTKTYNTTVQYPVKVKSIYKPREEKYNLFCNKKTIYLKEEDISIAQLMQFFITAAWEVWKNINAKIYVQRPNRRRRKFCHSIMDIFLHDLLFCIFLRKSLQLIFLYAFV